MSKAHIPPKIRSHWVPNAKKPRQTMQTHPSRTQRILYTLGPPGFAFGQQGFALGPRGFLDTNESLSLGAGPNAKPQCMWFHVAVEYRLYI